MIHQVISGGQTGADIAGLKAAKLAGIKTGGWMPKGWRTLDGPRPEYRELYGMCETLWTDYPSRTEHNVQSSEGTLLFASNLKSPGTKYTMFCIANHQRPSLIVEPASPWSHDWTASWITDSNICILNIAGNSERTAPGIEQFVMDYLAEVFSVTQKCPVS